MGLFTFFLSVSLLIVVPFANAKEIYFEIPEGTSDEFMDWNDKSKPVIANVGDVLIIKNLDSQPHQLHTDGRPCDHGDRMEPFGGTWSCVLEKPYNALEEEEPTKDHFNYDLKFWIIVN